MKSVKSQDTDIELRLRKALWKEGIRYRKNYKKLVGKPDIAITKWKIAIFCDASFWHGKDFDTKKPVSNNAEYWRKKISRNIERDKEVNQQLKEMGWTVLRFWDDEIHKHLDNCVLKIKETIASKQNEAAK
jgi:DNA mismatch endonuclease (patch repair protein)